MGAGAELTGKNKTMQDKLGINEEGLVSAETMTIILDSYYALKEESYQSWNAAETLIEFDLALTSTAFTEIQRKVIASHYSLGLNNMQTSKLLKISVRDVKSNLEEAIEVLEAVHNGWESNTVQFTKSKATNLDEYLYEVGAGLTNPFDATTAVMNNLLIYLTTTYEDAAAVETMHQREHGIPQHCMDELFPTEYDPEMYPFHRSNDTGKKTSTNDYFYKQQLDNNVSFDNRMNFPDPKRHPLTGKKRTFHKDAERGYESSQQSIY